MNLVANELPVLIDGDLRLRPPGPEDVAARYALGNTPEIQRMFGGDPKATRPMSQEQAQAWVDHHLNEPYAWMIEESGRLIGSVRLHTLNVMDRRASLAIGILDPERLGCGVGTRAMHLVVRHAFQTMELHRLSVRVVSYNTRAIAAYRKVGFVEEGREREAARVGETWHDDVLLGLLTSEYSANESRAI